MNNIILASIVAGSLAALLAGSVAAQTANGTETSGYTVKTVNPIRPFGTINVYNVGVDVKHVSAWVKVMSAGEKQEMVSRCSVIIQNQQNYYAETTTFCQNFAIAVAETLSK